MSTTQLHPIATLSALPQALQAIILQQRACLQAADSLEKADLYVIAHAFRFTAAQEEEQAAILQGLLGDEPLPPLPPQPAPASADALLTAAIAHEDACARDLLPRAAREAEAAGRPRAARTLLRIAENEQRHARRFRQYLDALTSGSLLRSAEATSWVCLPCGGLHHGPEAPESCEGCGATRGHFIRSSFRPFALP